MIFKGEPNLFVRFSNKTVIRVTGKKGFYFNGKGEYETDNDLLCRVLKQHFEVETSEKENNMTDDKQIEEIITEEEKKTFKCKQCDYKTANRGELLAHYRQHKKGE